MCAMYDVAEYMLCYMSVNVTGICQTLDYDCNTLKSMIEIKQDKMRL